MPKNNVHTLIKKYFIAKNYLSFQRVVTLLISFVDFSLAFTTWLAVWRMMPSFRLISAFDMAFLTKCNRF
jgi:hypothetical protein